jgi:asparagine synthase (glutamine-hydrolysing)
VSEKYGTEHHDYRMEEDNFISLYRKALWHYEHPLNDPNAVATYFLCQNAAEKITVMLSGEGADESFMGYARFNNDSIRRLRFRTFLYRHPALREIIYRLWPVSKGKALFNITRYNPAMYVLTYSDLNSVDKLLKGNDSAIDFRLSASDSAQGDTLNEAILQDEICDLMQWFWRADRMGMASSMELRVPFCTRTMFELANSIPYDKRVYNGERKAVLKKIAEKYIDHDQIYRKKVGFGTPVDDWINRDGPYRKLYEETVESEKFKKRDFFDHKHFNEIYSAHKNSAYRELNSGFMWTYFNLETWYRIFFESGWKELV